MQAVATVQTEFGDAYLKRLCRHFAHKIPAMNEGRTGRIEFPFGVCHIDVTDTEMRFRVEIDDPDHLDRAKRVLEDHLTRMANRDEPEFQWHAAETS